MSDLDCDLDCDFDCCDDGCCPDSDCFDCDCCSDDCCNSCCFGGNGNTWIFFWDSSYRTERGDHGGALAPHRSVVGESNPKTPSAKPKKRSKLKRIFMFWKTKKDNNKEQELAINKLEDKSRQQAAYRHEFGPRRWYHDDDHHEFGLPRGYHDHHEFGRPRTYPYRMEPMEK